MALFLPAFDRQRADGSLLSFASILLSLLVQQERVLTGNGREHPFVEARHVQFLERQTRHQFRRSEVHGTVFESGANSVALVQNLFQPIEAFIARAGAGTFTSKMGPGNLFGDVVQFRLEGAKRGVVV